MKYYAILKEGCDYTIGCGEHLISFDVKNTADPNEEAIIKLEEAIKENYTGDYELESVLLFPEDSLIPVNIKAIYKKLDDEALVTRKEYERQKDLEQFEQLKAKLKM